MAKFDKKLKARRLRESGLSIQEISRKLEVSKGSVSTWCRDIILTDVQVEKLNRQWEKGNYLARLKGAATQKKRRLEEIENLRREGISEIGKLTEREFFISGIALYWGEGLKTYHKFGFSNSDPKMVVYMVEWIKRFCKVNTVDLACQVGINQIHEYRGREVEDYWSNLTNIPLSQFNKISYKKVQSKKVYQNEAEHYGTLRVEIRKSTKHLRKMLGWIEGIYLGRE